MIVRLPTHDEPFTAVTNRTLNDERLSGLALSTLVRLLNKPPSWKVDVKYIVKHFAEGRDAVLKAMRELRKYGYAEQIERRAENGTYQSHEWIIYELPKAEMPAELVQDTPVQTCPPVPSYTPVQACTLVQECTPVQEYTPVQAWISEILSSPNSLKKHPRPDLPDPVKPPGIKNKKRERNPPPLTPPTPVPQPPPPLAGETAASVAVLTMSGNADRAQTIHDGLHGKSPCNDSPLPALSPVEPGGVTELCTHALQGTSPPPSPVLLPESTQAEPSVPETVGTVAAHVQDIDQALGDIPHTVRDTLLAIARERLTRLIAWRAPIMPEILGEAWRLYTTGVCTYK